MTTLLPLRHSRASMGGGGDDDDDDDKDKDLSPVVNLRNVHPSTYRSYGGIGSSSLKLEI